MNVSEESPVLSSWKDIARYVGKGVRTVQRWEHHLGLPVRRPNGASHKSAVLLERRDLDAWLETRFSPRGAILDLTAKGAGTQGSAYSVLREGIQTARNLRKANHELSEQISESVRRLRLLTEQYDRFSDPLNGPWSIPGPIAQERPARSQPKQIA